MYQKQIWKNLPDQTTPLSANRLNHLETQYEEARAYTDSKSSDTLASAKDYTDQELAMFSPDVTQEVWNAVADLGLENITGAADSRVLSSLVSDKTTWVFTGSSTTSMGGYIKTMLASLEMTFGKGSYLTSPPPSEYSGISFVNEGQGNTTSASYLPEDRIARIKAMGPDIVVHAIGSNDWYYGTTIPDYKINLQSSINSLNASPLKPVHILLHQHERADIVSSESSVWDDFGIAMREVAGDNQNCIFIDTSENMRKAGVGLAGGNDFGLLKSDKVHLTPKGDEVLGLTTLSLMGLPANRGTGWEAIPLNGGANGSCHYRVSGSRVDLRFHYSQALNGGATTTVAIVPEWLLPEVSTPIPTFANGYADVNAVLSIGTGGILAKNRGTGSTAGFQGYVSFFR